MRSPIYTVIVVSLPTAVANALRSPQTLVRRHEHRSPTQLPGIRSPRVFMVDVASSIAGSTAYVRASG